MKALQSSSNGLQRARNGRVRGAARMPLVRVAAVILGALLVSDPARGQVIQGKVTDSRTQEPVATARVSLFDAEGQHVATTLTNTEGGFRLNARRAGVYRLESERLGYAKLLTDTLRLVADEWKRSDLQLSPEAVTLDAIEIDVYPGSLLHDATLAGVYARRARSASVGNNRVLVRGDPMFDSAMKMKDLVPLWASGKPRGPFGRPPQCRFGSFLYIDGREVSKDDSDQRRFVMEMPVVHLEAVEFYRDPTMVPQSVRHRDARLPSEIRQCGVVVIWTQNAPR